MDAGWCPSFETARHARRRSTVGDGRMLADDDDDIGLRSCLGS